MPPRVETLAGGLRVVLVPCEAESVAFGVFVASGSRHEPAALSGISHFIEHMLFKGTPTRSALDITRAIEGRGGNFNAFTGEESTAYFAHLPAEYLAEAVAILADMYRHAKIADEDFQRERTVIVEEIKMYADEPDSIASENLQRALFPNHPLGRPVAGTPETLAKMTPAALRRYIRSHYVNGRTVIVIAGKFEADEALALVRKAFPFRGSAGLCAAAPTREFESPIAEVRVEKEIVQSQLALGYRTFGVDDSRKYAATVLDAVLGRGMASRLFQEVREKRGLSYDISSHLQFFEEAGMFTVTAGTDAAKASRTLAIIDREIDRIRRVRVGAAELKRIKEFLIGNFRLSHEKVTSKLFYYGSMMLSFGRIVRPEDQIEAVRAVTAEDVRKVAEEIFDPTRRSVSWVVPKASQRA